MQVVVASLNEKKLKIQGNPRVSGGCSRVGKGRRPRGYQRSSGGRSSDTKTYHLLIIPCIYFLLLLLLFVMTVYNHVCRTFLLRGYLSMTLKNLKHGTLFVSEQDHQKGNKLIRPLQIIFSFFPGPPLGLSIRDDPRLCSLENRVIPKKIHRRPHLHPRRQIMTGSVTGSLVLSSQHGHKFDS